MAEALWGPQIRISVVEIMIVAMAKAKPAYKPAGPCPGSSWSLSILGDDLQAVTVINPILRENPHCT